MLLSSQIFPMWEWRWWKVIVYSELESVSRAAGLMILQVDGATASWWWQVDLVHGKCIFILRNPVAKRISVICRNDSYLCEKDKTSLWAVCTYCLTEYWRQIDGSFPHFTYYYLLGLPLLLAPPHSLPQPTFSTQNISAELIPALRNLLLEFSVFTFEQKWDNTYFWFSIVALVPLTSSGLLKCEISECVLFYVTFKLQLFVWLQIKFPKIWFWNT